MEWPIIRGKRLAANSYTNPRYLAPNNQFSGYCVIFDSVTSASTYHYRLSILHCLNRATPNVTTATRTTL